MTRLPAGPIAPPAAGIQLQFGPHGYPSSRAGSSASMSRLGGGRTWWAHLEFTRINIKPTIRKKEIEDARGSGELLSRSGTPRLLDGPAAISCGMTVTVAEPRGRQSSR